MELMTHIPTIWNKKILDKYRTLAEKFRQSDTDPNEWSLFNGTKLVLNKDKYLFHWTLTLNTGITLTDSLANVDTDTDIGVITKILCLTDQFFIDCKRGLAVLPELEVNNTKVLFDTLTEVPGYVKDKRLTSEQKEQIRQQVLEHYNLKEFNGKLECRVPKDVTMLYCKFILGTTYNDIRQILGLTTHPIRRMRELCEALVERPTEFEATIKTSPWPELTRDAVLKALNLK